MINLLPPDFKKQLRAARNNTVIRRYYLLLLMSAGLLAIVFGVGFVVTLDQEAKHISIKQESEQAAKAYEDTRKAAENFSKDLAVAKTILASDVRFSQLISDIAGVIPSGVVLRNLSLNTDDASNSPLTISANAKTYDDAVELKNSLEQSPIFENVSLVSASTNTNGEGAAAIYPVSVSVSVKFSKTAPAKEDNKR